MRAITQHPLWRNVVLRTVLYYLVIAGIGWLMRSQLQANPGVLGGETLSDLVGGAPQMAENSTQAPSSLAAAIAMLTAFATALPVAWIYTLTRRKKGFQQSVVQTYLILPVVAAGIVVLVKYSLALAFSLGGVVAAVRFRTSLDDSKDAAGIFVVIAIGMAAAVAPPVAWVVSVAFNLLMLLLWWTDFGRPMSLEGKEAEKRLERALENANQTGMFLSRIDDEILKGMSPDQLEALADRAWRRRKRNDPELREDDSVAEEHEDHGQLLRIRAADVDQARELCEPKFAGLFAEWKYLGSVKENDIRVLEYRVVMADTVTPGVVTDDLRFPDSPLRGVEIR